MSRFPNKVHEQFIRRIEGIAAVIKQARKAKKNCKPMVVEFSGSPKSGKTSCISALDLFFRRNGYKTKLIGEKAHISPIENKTNPLFNMWTITSTLSDLAAVLGDHNSHHDPDVILIDRGVFDAFCWFSWLCKMRHLEDENLEAIKRFLFMPKWREYIDLVLIFQTKPELSLEREHKMLLTKTQGSIMNKGVLRTFNETLTECRKNYSDQFKSIRFINSDKSDIQQLNYDVTLETLEALSGTSSENIGFVERNKIKGQRNYVFAFKELGIGIDQIAFQSRHAVEDDDAKVQFVPITIITNKERNRICVVRKNKKPGSSSPEYKKILPYIGGHVRVEDRPIGMSPTLLGTLNKCLQREIKEEIGIDHVPNLNGNSMAIWINDKNKSKQHIAVCDLWEVDFSTFKPRIDPNEFSLSNREELFMELADLKSKPNLLEDWGVLILQRMFNVEVQRVSSKTLFEDLD